MNDIAANLPIAEYLLDVIDELDGDALAIVNRDLLHEQVAKMMFTGFPVLRGLLSPLSDVGTMRETPEDVARSEFPEAQEPVKCGNCGWLGLDSDLGYYPIGDARCCPNCGAFDHIGSAIPTSELAPVAPIAPMHCELCMWKGNREELIDFGLGDCCPNCSSAAFVRSE